MNITALPNECLLKIFRLISVQDHCALAQVSKQFKQCADDESQWRPLIKDCYRPSEEDEKFGFRSKNIFRNSLGAIDPDCLLLHPKGKQHYDMLKGSRARTLLKAAIVDLDTAEIVLDHEELYSKFFNDRDSGTYFTEIAKSHLVSAIIIVEDREKFKLKPSDLQNINLHYFPTKENSSELLINLRKKCQRISEIQEKLQAEKAEKAEKLLGKAIANPGAAKLILDQKELYSRFFNVIDKRSGTYFTEIAKSHLVSAINIVENREKFKLTENDLQKINLHYFPTKENPSELLINLKMKCLQQTRIKMREKLQAVNLSV